MQGVLVGAQRLRISGLGAPEVRKFGASQSIKRKSFGLLDDGIGKAGVGESESKRYNCFASVESIGPPRVGSLWASAHGVVGTVGARVLGGTRAHAEVED